MALLELLAGHFKKYRRRGLQDVAARLHETATPHAAAVALLVNGTLRLRRLVYVGLVIRYRQARSRIRHALAKAPSPGNGRMRSMSLLCPTRERPRNARALLASLRKTAARPERVELLFYVDADDPQRDEYTALAREEQGDEQGKEGKGGVRGVRCTVVVGEPMSVSKSWNVLARRATGDLLMMANDDQIYVDYGWDLRLDREFAAFPDEIVCMYFDAGQYDKVVLPEFPGGDFPIVTRKWYETLGYFTPGIFEFWSNEKWILDIARRAGRLHIVAGVLVDHLHYDVYKSPYDKTYQRHRSTRDKSMRDLALYLNTVPDRNQAAARLRREIPGAEGREQEIAAPVVGA